MFLCSICKNKNFLYKCLGSFIQKFFLLMAQAAAAVLRKYINILFFSFICTNIFSIPPPHLITINCTLSYLLPCWELPPPSPIEHFVFTLFTAEADIGAGGLPLMRSPCRGTVAAGRGGGSSSAPCRGRAGSFHSSPLLTGTGCEEWAAGGRARNHSSSH